MKALLSHSTPEKIGLFDCIIKRLERIETHYARRLRRPLLLEGPYRLNMKELEAEIEQVELMLSLSDNCKSFGGEFWAAIARWQAASYRESCVRLLEDYKERTRHISGDRDVNTIISALSKAVRAALDQAEPSPGKATLEDVFKIRNIYDNPELKALVESDMFTAQRRKELYEAADEWVLQQPVFPPECDALLSDNGGCESTPPFFRNGCSTITL